eukprot:TRINITY_DN6108_c0_g1_i1.p1 TRINITY_DN6108_c0_g1~~TRINITY_DN6108_c0_g1_i1.p1  ORF type:complete len:331 (+),score=89.04 TRINITY_DN6108_c0_g1_i1:45-1037(+)
MGEWLRNEVRRWLPTREHFSKCRCGFRAQKCFGHDCVGLDTGLVRPLCVAACVALLVLSICDIVSFSSKGWLKNKADSVTNGQDVATVTTYGLVRFVINVNGDKKDYPIRYADPDLATASRVCFALAFFEMFVLWVGAACLVPMAMSIGRHICLWWTAFNASFLSFLLSLTVILLYSGGKPKGSSFDLKWCFWLQLTICLLLLVISIVVMFEKPRALPYIAGWKKLTFVVGEHDAEGGYPAAASSSSSASPPPMKPRKPAGGAPPPLPPRSDLRSCRALYDCAADDNRTDLSFSRGDIITVVNDEPGDGWFMGELNGRQGIVPSNYVTAL